MVTFVLPGPAASPNPLGPWAVDPHTFRKTYGTRLYDLTGDIKMVQDVVNYSAISDRASYCKQSSFIPSYAGDILGTLPITS